MKISKHLAEHVVSELMQMGYTVEGDKLNPPEKLSDFACKFFGVRAATPAKPSPHADADEIALFDEYMRGCHEYNIEPDLGTAFHAGRKSARGAATPADPMDWPLPCDLTAGGITIAKGCPLSTVQARLEVQTEANAMLLRRMNRELAATPAAPAPSVPDKWKIPQHEVGGSAEPVTQEDVDAARDKVLWCLGSSLLSGSDEEARQAFEDRHLLYSLLGDANCRLVGRIASAPQPAVTAGAVDALDAVRLDWLDQNIFNREMGEWDAKYGGHADDNMWVLFSPKGAHGTARGIIDAAIAAQWEVKP